MLETNINELYLRYFNDEAKKSVVFGWLIDSATTSQYFQIRPVPNDYTGTPLLSSVSDAYMVDNSIDLKAIRIQTDGSLSIYNGFDEQLDTIIYIDQSHITLTSDALKTINTIWHLHQLYSYTFEHLNSVSDIVANGFDVYDIDCTTKTRVSTASTIPSDTAFDLKLANNAVVSYHLCMLKSIKTEKDLIERLFIYSNITKLMLQCFVSNIFVNVYKSTLNHLYSNPSVYVNTSDTNLNTTGETKIDRVLNFVDHSKKCVSNQINVLNTIHTININNGLSIQKQDDCSFKVVNANSFILDLFSEIQQSKHIIMDMNTQKMYDIPHDTSITVKDGNHIIKFSTSKCIIDENNTNPLKIVFKTSGFYKAEYDDRVDNVTELNNKMNEQKDEYKTALTNNKYMKAHYYGIDTIYYLVIVMLILVIIFFVAGNSDSDRSIRSLLLIVIVSILYGMFLSFMETKEFFISARNDYSDLNTKITHINDKLDDYLNAIVRYSPTIGLGNVYNELLNVIGKDIKKLNVSNTMLIGAVNKTNDYTNSNWHDLYKKTMFIHTVFLITITILLYYWFSYNFPENTPWLMFLTVLLCLVIVFNYFRNVHRVVRTKYRHKYWMNMKISQ